MVVWRERRESDGVAVVNPEQSWQKLVDMSLVSAAKVVESIERSHILTDYRLHPGILWRIPNFRVGLGIGLHKGWAIEGAIGSEFKVEASYLSPNVNMASLLQEATHEFGTHIIMSGEFANDLSKRMRAECRLIDVVRFRGQLPNQCTKLFTLDLNTGFLPVETEITVQTLLKIPEHNRPTQRQLGRLRFQLKKDRELQKTKKWGSEFVPRDLLDRGDLHAMRKPYCQTFRNDFEHAYMNYQAGEWRTAHHFFVKLQRQHPELAHDGPTTVLLRHMEASRKKAPASWKGVRAVNY